MIFLFYIIILILHQIIIICTELVMLWLGGFQYFFLLNFIYDLHIFNMYIDECLGYVIIEKVICLRELSIDVGITTGSRSQPRGRAVPRTRVPPPKLYRRPHPAEERQSILRPGLSVFCTFR